MKYIGSSGIRMKWGPELVEIGRNIGHAMSEKYENVIIASDFRESSDSLVEIIKGALLSSGTSLYDAGKVPTPTLAYAAKDFDAGIMVTASHNPPEYNGIKLWNPDGSAFSEEQMKELKEDKADIASWEKTGGLYNFDALSLHKEAIIKNANSLEGLKVIVDCSNGASCVITPYLLRILGAEVTTINCHPDGRFPGHSSEPSEENLELLRKMVPRKGADLGIAHDGDADRFIAVSSSGRYLNGDMIMAVFIREFGYGKVVAPVDSSMLLENYAEVERSKVGDANVSQRIKELGYEFGGEQSGTQIFAEWRLTPDAIYSAVKFSEIALNNNIDEIIDSFPSYTTLRKSIFYEDRKKMEGSIERFLKEYEVLRIDGWRVKMDDLWFLIRFSGTEPKIRITVEAEDKGKAEEMMKRIVKGIGGE